MLDLEAQKLVKDGKLLCWIDIDVNASRDAYQRAVDFVAAKNLAYNLSSNWLPELGGSALKRVKEELGVSDVSERFKSFGSAPIAAASLGQVYRCRLRASGHDVALKVQRPDMIRAVSLDLFLLRRAMERVAWRAAAAAFAGPSGSDRRWTDSHP